MVLEEEETKGRTVILIVENIQIEKNNKLNIFSFYTHDVIYQVKLGILIFFLKYLSEFNN